MQAAWKVRGLGLAFVVAAVPAFLYVDEPLGGMLAFGLAATGLFVAVVVAEATVPARGLQATVAGDAGALSDLADGLGLEGTPHYVHDQGNVGAERLFLPASKNERPIPILDPDTLAYSGTGGTKVGLALAPPGLELLRLHARETRRLPEGASLSDAEAFLSGLFATHDLVRGVNVSKPGDRLRVRFEASALEVPCLSDPVEPACEATGCVACQAVGCALARSLEHPVAVDQARIEGDRVTLHLALQGEGQSEAPEAEDTPLDQREPSAKASDRGGAST